MGSLQRMKILTNLIGRQEGLMSFDTCQLVLLVRVFVLASLARLFPLGFFASQLCCSESEDSSDLSSRIYSSNNLCSVYSFFMTLPGPMCYTLFLTVFKCTTCQQSKPHQRNRFFSRFHDRYTLACKARPPSTDVWTLLSVIVIVIVIALAVQHQTQWINRRIHHRHRTPETCAPRAVQGRRHTPEQHFGETRNGRILPVEVGAVAFRGYDACQDTLAPGLHSPRQSNLRMSQTDAWHRPHQAMRARQPIRTASRDSARASAWCFANQQCETKKTPKQNTRRQRSNTASPGGTAGRNSQTAWRIHRETINLHARDKSDLILCVPERIKHDPRQP